MPYVSVRKYLGKPVLQVEYCGKTNKYPLTQRGCIDAGRDLYKAGCLEWLCSSSVDFPRETKPRFIGDIRQLLQEGFARAAEEVAAS